MIETKLKEGLIIEDNTWKIKLEIISLKGDPKRGQSAIVKVLDCWDDYINGGSPQGCFSSYMDIGKEYRLYRNRNFPNEDAWIFSNKGLKDRTGSMLLLDIEDGVVCLDMDS